MIGLILGTSEGKIILSELNKYTDDILISTATEYGGDLLKGYRYKVLNSQPLLYADLKKFLKENGVEVLVDATHPYAVQISNTSMRIADELGIEYIRFERQGVVKSIGENPSIVELDDYEDLAWALKDVEGPVLNTTGSRNIERILNLNLKNRIIHRVLPSLKVMQEVTDLGVTADNLICIKGPVSYDLNTAFLKEYGCSGLITKDSGAAGGTYEKIKAALDLGLKVFVIGRKTVKYGLTFNDIYKMCDYIREKYV